VPRAGPCRGLPILEAAATRSSRRAYEYSDESCLICLIPAAVQAAPGNFRCPRATFRSGSNASTEHSAGRRSRPGAIKAGKFSAAVPGYISCGSRRGDNWTALHSTAAYPDVAFSGKPARLQDEHVQHLQERCARSRNQALEPRPTAYTSGRPYAELGMPSFVAHDCDSGSCAVLQDVLNRENR